MPVRKLLKPRHKADSSPTLGRGRNKASISARCMLHENLKPVWQSYPGRSPAAEVDVNLLSEDGGGTTSFVWKTTIMRGIAMRIFK